MEKFEFLQTWTLQQFKSKNKTDKLEIKKNEKTGKYYFTCGNEKGVCSKRAISGKMFNPVISQVIGVNSDKSFLMLHHSEDKASPLVSTL